MKEPFNGGSKACGNNGEDIFDRIRDSERNLSEKPTGETLST